MYGTVDLEVDGIKVTAEIWTSESNTFNSDNDLVTVKFSMPNPPKGLDKELYSWHGRRKALTKPEAAPTPHPCMCGDPDHPGISDNDPPDWENPGDCRNCGGYCEQK